MPIPMQKPYRGKKSRDVDNVWDRQKTENGWPPHPTPLPVKIFPGLTEEQKRAKQDSDRARGWPSQSGATLIQKHCWVGPLINVHVVPGFYLWVYCLMRPGCSCKLWWSNLLSWVPKWKTSAYSALMGLSGSTPAYSFAISPLLLHPSTHQPHFLLLSCPFQFFPSTRVTFYSSTHGSQKKIMSAPRCQILHSSEKQHFRSTKLLEHWLVLSGFRCI